MGKLVFITFIVGLLFWFPDSISTLNSPWSWRCVLGSCQKELITNDTQDTALSLAACRLLCSESGALWPKPTGNVSVGTYLAKINIKSIDIEGIISDTPSSHLIRAAVMIFKEEVQAIIPKNVHLRGGKPLIINIDIENTTISRLTLDTDESYVLEIAESTDGRLNVSVTATTFFGARHGLVTLSQLIIYDDLREELQAPQDVLITDTPAYPHRGILLDTSRNYVNVDTIKRTLKGMGASKLNTFHWHITDSHSFPYVSKSQPDLSKYGAYSPTKIYSPRDIAEIIQYGLERGIRIIPEFDAPAHVGEGWQETGLLTCFKWQPWENYCSEPPCGQFNPTKAALYDIIEDIYGDMFEQFQPDVFHMGGDEVNIDCWNSTDSIVEWMSTEKGWGRTTDDFIKLWDYFQSQALQKVYAKAGWEIPVIMWTSDLTDDEYVLSYLPNDKYIIQVWTTGTDEEITNLLDNGYKLILSNYDALYLDCGFAGWVTDGNNWCSPYIGWQTVYDNKPVTIAGNKTDQILGAEAVLWTEQADSASIDGRLWPRSAAMAEVFWSEPTTGWEDAEERFLVHRERLITLGIDADAIEPEWCLQNEENCREGSVFNSLNITN